MADESAPLALATTEADLLAVVAAHSRETGYPRTCLRADGRPAPPGVPCVVERAADPEPILDSTDPKAPKVLGYTYPAPADRKGLPAAVKFGTRSELEAIATAAPAPKPVEDEKLISP